jgi:hypothetical protein
MKRVLGFGPPAWKRVWKQTKSMMLKTPLLSQSPSGDWACHSAWKQTKSRMLNEPSALQSAGQPASAPLMRTQV